MSKQVRLVRTGDDYFLGSGDAMSEEVDAGELVYRLRPWRVRVECRLNGWHVQEAACTRVSSAELCMAVGPAVPHPDASSPETPSAAHKRPWFITRVTLRVP